MTYLNAEKGSVCDLDEKSAESFRKYDLKKLYSRIGHLFRCQKKGKRLRYSRYRSNRI